MQSKDLRRGIVPLNDTPPQFMPSRISFLLFVVLLTGTDAFAQDSYSTGTCETPQAETMLEVGNVRARLLNNGGLFWKGNPNIYEVPAGSGIQASHAANLWIGGLVDNEIRTAASTYGPYEMWAGPMPDDDRPPTDCSTFDRFWHLDLNTENRYRVLNEGPSDEALAWPADLGAPYRELNGTDGYQPDEGDLPVLLGDHSVWWIMNDRGNVHTRTDSRPLGVEVQATAFGFNVQGDLGNTTFYRYRIENKGSKRIDSMGVSMWADFDLGNTFDDRLGTDTTLALFYVYNADDEENLSGYDSPIPAFGVTILEASHSNGSLPTDVGAHAALHATSSMAYNGSGGATGDPTRFRDHYAYMRAQWKDGAPLTLGGHGYWFSLVPTSFWMPGDPVAGAFWSELNTGTYYGEMAPADRRGLISFQGFTLSPGEWVQFTFAFVWARGVDHLDSITELRKATGFLHDNKSIILAPRTSDSPPFEDGNPSKAPQYPFWVDEPYPNPASDKLTLRASFDKSGPATVRVVDVLGRTRIEQTTQISSAGARDITLDVTSLTPGSYTATVESWSHRATHSFVVLR